MATPATNTRASALHGFVDLNRYPLHRLDSATGRQLIEDCREQLGVDGCVVLKNFVPAAAIERLEAETLRLSPKAHYNECETNPYNSAADPD
ncbi:MAG: hypothetical protein ACOCP9_06460, partial [Halofilum sp. (in: g-proteobacteria)]